MPIAKTLRLTCWPVGQGLFSEAELQRGQARWNLVYDCGTQGRMLNTQTGPWAEGRRRYEIDLLVLSHFHWDHISGVPSLFENGVTVKRAWIPYVSPRQAVVNVAAAAAHGVLSGYEAEGMRQILELVSSPARWLRERDVDVHEIGGGEDLPSVEVPPSPDPPGFEGDGPPEPVEPDDGEELELGQPRTWPEAFEEGSGFACEVASVDAGGAGGEQPLSLVTWAWEPRNEEWADAIKYACPGCRDLVQAIMQPACQEITQNEIRSLVRTVVDRSERAELHDFYCRLQQHINRTSLFLLVCPLRLSDLPTVSLYYGQDQLLWPFAGLPFPCERCCRDCCYLLYRCLQYGVLWAVPPAALRHLVRRDPGLRQKLVESAGNALFPGVLWCGDADAQTLDQLMSHANDPLRALLRTAFLLQVPHHGASSSWHQEFYDESRPACCFVSYGVTNSYGHPAPSIMWRLKPIEVTEQTYPFRASITWL